MTKATYLVYCIASAVLLGAVNSCFQKKPSASTSFEKGAYGYDAAFLKAHLEQLIELRNEDGAAVLVTGDYQGRVMTSTAAGDSGLSFGWINYDLIQKAQALTQFNPVGGEERFWIGPEGGQFSFYFAKDRPFDFENWQVPPFIDTTPYAVVSADDRHVSYHGKATVQNYSGTTFNLEIRRSVAMLNRGELSDKIGKTFPENLRWVAYETTNELKNAGETAWTKEKGLISVWLLGMFTPSEKTVAIIPFRPQSTLESHLTKDYFGAIPPERLTTKDSVLLLKCDGRHRSKLGLSPEIAKPVAGSFDYHKNVLTLILYTVDPTGDYVNSKWEIQGRPFSGDVVNAYNDGPLADGTQMGPFYELESSSAAKPLQPGETLVYKQVTCHFEGDYAALDKLAQATLGISLENAALP